MDLSNFRIHVREHTVRHFHESPIEDDCITHLSADVVYDTEQTGFDVTDRNNQRNEKNIGTLSGLRLRIDALMKAGLNSSEGLLVMADEESQDLSDIFRTLNAKGYLENIESGDIVIIDRVHVLNSFRGFDFGLRMIETVLKTYEHEFAALTVAPLDHIEDNIYKGRSKLREYYARMGFKQVGRTQVMTLHHSQRLEPFSVKPVKKGIRSLKEIS